MTKKKSHPKKPEKAAKDDRPKTTRRSGQKGSGKNGQGGQALPSPRVTASQVDALVAVVQGLNRRLQNFERRQQAENQRLEQERQEREQRPSAPAPPSPHDAAFAALPGFMAEMRERVGGIESRLQQPSRAPSLDVPASVQPLRRMFAGACKTLGIAQPTPAIIGKAMHEKKIFAPQDDATPRNLLEFIYAKANITNHLSPKIRDLLERYGKEPPEPSTPPAEQATSPKQQRAPQTKPGRESAKIAKELGPEFDTRFLLIENTGCGRRERLQQGGKTKYCRYLTPSGCELFNGWPEWTDATGGIGFADERTESPPSQPERTGPDGCATQPVM